ncbi:MAG: PAS domain S-box protein [Sphingobacteriia bacterium]|nr:MAG: PAS domain S-box protein [Sphingobacteriia bacterium]
MRYPYSLDKNLSQMINSNNHYIVTTDLNGNICFCNESFKRYYQIVGESMMGVNIDALFASNEVGMFKSAVNDCIRKTVNTVALRFKMPGMEFSHSVIHFDLTIVFDKRELPTGVLMIGKDASLSIVGKKSENYTTGFNDQQVDLSHNQEWFREIANYMPDLMWVSDQYHQISFVNKAWTVFRGTEIEDELGNGWLQAIHPEDLERILDERKDAFIQQSPYSIIYRFLKVDGNYRWMNTKGNPMYNRIGEFLGYAGTSIDITAIKEAQLQIKRQQDLMETTKIEFGKFTKVAQKISSIIILCNASNQINWVNDAFVKLTGYSLKEVSGKQPGSILKGVDTSKETLDRIGRVIKQGRGIRAEILYYTKSGSKLWLDIMIETLYDKDGAVTGYITIQKDITLKKVSEKEVQEQMTHLKKISFITSHELRHEFSKILQLLQTAKFQDHNLLTYGQIFADIELSANLMNDAIYKLNDQINFASSNSISLNKFLLNQQIEEICLVDDDHLVNKLNELIIRNVLPSLPVSVFDDIDDALKYMKENPTLKRKIFLDLNFTGRSGWDFLHEYEKMSQPWPVVILTSSIDHSDYEKSKKFSNVTHFITKPLTIDQFEKLSELDTSYA